MKPREGDVSATRQKKGTHGASSPKGKYMEHETRRDAAKAYGLLASQRNRIAAERKSKKDSTSTKSTSNREKTASPKVRSKSQNSNDGNEKEDCSGSNSRVQAWLCDTPLLSVKLQSIDDGCDTKDTKRSTDTPTRSSVDKATQTPHSYLRSPTPQLSYGDCHTVLSEQTTSDKGDRQYNKNSVSRAKAMPVFDITSSCTIDENDRERLEEYEILARIQKLEKCVAQELKERRAVLLAEKRVILLRIEEIRLRQEVRALERDVSKSQLELRRLAEKEDHQSSSPTISRQSSPDQLDPAETTPCTEEMDVAKNTFTSQETRDSDSGACDVLNKTGIDAVRDNEGVSLQNNSLIEEASSKEQDSDDPHCNLAATDASKNEEALGIPDRDLSEIKEYFSRSSHLRSAPAVLFGAIHEEETASSFIKASSYDGVEMLSLCDAENDDGLSKALDEAIERLAGGRLGVLRYEQTDHRSEASSQSDVLSHSFDDEDEYHTMLDSIPLNTNTPDIERQDGEEESDMFLDSETKEAQNDEAEGEENAISFPMAPLFSEMATQLPGMTAIDQSASTVFCSPRNGRSSPRSPRRQLSDAEPIRNTLSPEVDASANDASQNQRQTTTPPIPDVLITASSCSSCWVQFSQTDSEYIQALVIKFMQAFCDPCPPVHLDPNELPIPLKTFTAIQKEAANSQVQEAFDRAIFDAVNQRLAELYQWFNQLKCDRMSVNGWSSPSYSCLLEGVLQSILSTTDCDADPLAAYMAKENIIEQMLIKDAKRLCDIDRYPTQRSALSLQMMMSS